MRLVPAFLLFSMALSPAWSSVFIQSIPMRAEVFTNGARAGVSPLLIERDPPSPLRVSFKKDGFYPVEYSASLSGGITNLTTLLTPIAVSISFPDRDNIDYNGKRYKSDSIRNLGAGTYEIFPDTNSVTMRRVNPNKQFMWFGIGAGVLGIASGITSQILADGFYKEFQTATNINQAMRGMNLAMFCDNLASICYGFGGTGAAVGGWFFIDDLLYESKNTAIVLHDNDTGISDRSLYEKAMDYQSQLDTSNSLVLFNRVVSQFPDSQYYPISLFRRAKILSMRGETVQAQADYEKLRKDYPVYDLYELILKDLGDLYLAKGDADSAAGCYWDMRLAPRYYQTWETDLYLFRAQIARAKKSGSDDDMGLARKTADKLLADNRVPEDKKTEIKASLGQ